ncbi:MAG TPA: DoxX family protein [Jiangellaceae bacterium]|nr:DoxX family protein [Jiangellaceae bacterium]
MASLITLVLVTLILFAAGAAGVRRLRPWPVALRGGLAAMFVLTGVSHFVGMREDLINMVPPALPEPALLVTITGILELAGAAGLLWRRTAPWAAAGLSALLVGMFPANVYAAVEGLTLGGAPAMALVPRTLMQLLFLAVTLSVVGYHLRERRRVMKASDYTANSNSDALQPAATTLRDRALHPDPRVLDEPGRGLRTVRTLRRGH